MRRILLALLGGLLACGQNGSEEHSASAPGINVLLISLDSTRRDLLGVYGYRARHAPGLSPSPALDRLAQEGVVLEDAYAPTSWTLPSHVGLLTGEPIVVHGVDQSHHRPDPSRPALAEVLREAGYRTAGFYSGAYLEPHFGHDRGFERYEARYGDPAALADLREDVAQSARRLEKALAKGRQGKGIAKRFDANALALNKIGQRVLRDVSSAAVSEGAIDALNEYAAGAEPFFIFAHYFDPHYDYTAPEPFASRFDPEYVGTMDGANFLSRKDLAGVDPRSPGARVKVASDRDLEHVRALYAGELAWTDSQIARVLERLQALSLAETTLVIVTADHGDEFFEHSGLGHRRTLFEEVIRAPLILRLPGRLPAGRRVAGVVSIEDIAATIFDIVDVPAPPHLQTSSFLPLIEGAQQASERSVISRLVATKKFSAKVDAPDGPVEADGMLVTVTETFRRGSLKVTRERNLPRLTGDLTPELRKFADEQIRKSETRDALRWIDLERHPEERPEQHSTDFSDPGARAALRAFRDRYRELLSKRGAAQVGEEDAELTARLRSLGYVEEGAGGAGTGADVFALPPPGESLLQDL